MEYISPKPHGKTKYRYRYLKASYKSHTIVVEEDAYFTELVRYIHLNPLRAGLVNSISELNLYHWCGHRAIARRGEKGWQDTDYVLKWFADRPGQARQGYLAFVEQGISLGRQPHLVGGGLVRSAGGWSEVKALRRVGENENYDARILGSGEFVTRVLSEASLAEKYRMAPAQFFDESSRPGV